MTLEEIKETYASPLDHTSIVYNVPIELLKEVQALFRKAGIKNRVRFRGPRKGNDFSTLKCNATSFAVYYDTSWSRLNRSNR